MTTKEKLQFGLQVFTILIFATLANKAIENKGSHGPMSSFHPMKGENMFIMDMDNIDGFDLENIGDIDIKDIKIEKEIINGEEIMKVIVNGEELSLSDNVKVKSFMIEDGSWSPKKGKKTMMKKKIMHHKSTSHHDSETCETCEEKDMICEDCKDKK